MFVALTPDFKALINARQAPFQKSEPSKREKSREAAPRYGYQVSVTVALGDGGGLSCVTHEHPGQNLQSHRASFVRAWNVFIAFAGGSWATVNAGLKFPKSAG